MGLVAVKRSRLLLNLGIGCSRCGWNEDICDIHHINGRKIADPHHHQNLCYLCPNCHRLAGKGKIEREQLVSFESQVGERWKEAYIA